MSELFILEALKHLQKQEFLAVDLLSKAALNKRLSHAYLFVGKDHISSMNVIKAFSKILLCDSQNATDNCLSCRVFDSGQHPDFRTWAADTDKSKYIKVEQIQELIAANQRFPVTSKKKVLVLEEVSQLRTEGANALLKTLEEPAEFTTIILTVDSLDNLLSTIISRCQIIPVTGSQEISEPVEINLAEYFPKSYLEASEMANKMSKTDKEEIILFLINLQKELWKVSKSIEINEKEFNYRIKFLEKLEEYINSINSYVNIKVILENLFIDLYTFRKYDTTKSIIYKN